MSGAKEVNLTRGERVQRILMVSCAVVLFVLGVLLLIEPLMATDAQPGKVMDNVGGTAATNTSCASA
jgi:hypothetical protein